MDSNITRNRNVDFSIVCLFKTIKKKMMEKGFKIWHAVISFLLLLITVVGLIVNQSTKIETQGLRINYLESAQRDNSLQLKEMNGKLNEILIILQNKEDRKGNR